MTTVHARAPVRIDFAGGWSDVPDFADAEGGRVVNAAITLYTHVECSPGGGTIRLFADDLGQRVFYKTPSEIRYDGTLDLHKAALNMMPVSGGIEIITRSEVPAGSGLGASASLDVCLLAALARCRDDTSWRREDLAELGFQLETDELGLRGGRQDQYAAALGGFLDLGFAVTGTSVRRLEVPASRAAELRRHVWVVYTGESHFSSRTHQQVWEAYHAGAANIGDALRQIRDAAGRAADAVDDGDWEALARAADDNWQQQLALHPTIATDAMRALERAVRDAGAWSFKAAGAGAGGCVLLFAPPDRGEEVARAVAAVGGTVLDWDFDGDGVTWR